LRVLYQRAPKLIRPETQSDLWSFIGGIARKNGFKALIVGGTEDHGHILLSLPAVMPLAKAVQLLKGASSRWMNETHGKGFSWQEGTALSLWAFRKGHTQLTTSNGRLSITGSTALRKSLLHSLRNTRSITIRNSIGMNSGVAPDGMFLRLRRCPRAAR
jgi:REP element-mobilizing transposase RayT